MSEDKEPKKITSLCLAGAFNRGICYIGSLKKLEESSLIDLKKVVSVSIGSLISIGIIIGYTPDEMYKLIVEKDTKEFMDISILKGNGGGVLKGEIYRRWVHNTIFQKLISNKWINDINDLFTLKDLYNRTNIDAIITTTCIYSENSEFNEGVVYLNHSTHPDIPITTAVNASMSFPFIFPPVEYKNAYFVDGGVLNNFPIEKIDKDGLGIRPLHKPLNGLECTKNPISYVNKVFELMSKHSEALKGIEYDNVLNIECENFNSVEFDMSIDDKITLYKLGYQAMEIYINTRTS